MKALKVVLAVTGVVCLLSASGALLPWTSIARFLEMMGLEAAPAHRLIVYCLRLVGLSFALIGVFFLILATDPLRYRPMLVLAVCGLWAMALAALVTGWRVGMPRFWYLGDATSCVIVAVLIHARWPKEVAPAPSG